jgi:hypothetical protein
MVSHPSPLSSQTSESTPRRLATCAKSTEVLQKISTYAHCFHSSGNVSNNVRLMSLLRCSYPFHTRLAQRCLPSISRSRLFLAPIFSTPTPFYFFSHLPRFNRSRTMSSSVHFGLRTNGSHACRRTVTVPMEAIRAPRYRHGIIVASLLGYITRNITTHGAEPQ